MQDVVTIGKHPQHNSLCSFVRRECIVLLQYSNLPVKFAPVFKFASQLSSHKIMKKSGFNFFSNLMVFTVNQTWQLVIKMLNTKYYVLLLKFTIWYNYSTIAFAFKMVNEGGRASCSMHIINPKKYLTIQICKSADRRTSYFCVCRTSFFLCVFRQQNVHA